MVPRAANLLLALISTSAAADGFRQPVHGPYRLPPGAYERRADLKSPLYPIRTGSIPTSSGNVAIARVQFPTTATASHSSHASSRQEDQGRSTTLSSNGSSESIALPTSDSFTRSSNLRSNPAAPQGNPPRTQSSNNSHVPTTVFAHTTAIVLSTNNLSEQTVSLPHDVKTSSSISTRTESTGVLASSLEYLNGSSEHAASSHPSAPLSTGTVSSGSRFVMAPTNWVNSSSALQTGHGHPANYTKPSFPPSRPSACTGATLNIKNASLDYWYAETYTQVDSTFLIEFNENETSTGWTLVPASGTLDITSAIKNPACSSTTTFNTELSQSGLEYSCSETPTPAAKATTVVEQTAYMQLNATFSNGDIPDVVVSPTPAALTVTNADGESTYHAGTSVVHFSQYEIVSKQLYNHWNGSLGCMETTEVYNLPKPASFEYEGDTAVNESLAVGKLGRMNFALLQALGESDVELPHTVALGDLEAIPTVVVVVEKVVVAAAGLGQGILAPAPSLNTPTATLPPGLSFERTTPTETGTTWVPFTAHVESSADSLDVPSETMKRPWSPQNTGGSGVGVAVQDGSNSNVRASSTSRGDGGDGILAVPFVARIDNNDVTLAIFIDPTKLQDVVTAKFSGRLVTATRVADSAPIFGGRVDVGRVASLIDGAAQPTNALQVLDNAQAALSPNAAASAIAAGLGITTPADNGFAGSPGPSSSGSGSKVDSGNANPELIIGTSVYTATREEAGIVLDGQTALPGGPPITVASQVVSLSPAATAVAIGGSVINVDGAIDAAGVDMNPSLTIGTSVFAATRVADGFVVGGQTLSAGGAPIKIGDSEVSLNSEGTSMIVGGFSINIATPGNVGAAANIPIIQLGTQLFTANAATQYNLEGSVLTPGGRVVVAGTTVSLGPSATRLIVNGKLQQLSPPTITPAPLLTIGDHVYKPNLGSTYDVGSSLLSPGGQVVVSGTTISIPSSGQIVVIDGMARSMGTGRSSAKHLATITAPPALVLNGKVVEPNAGTSYVIAEQTLTPGGVVTFNRPSGPETVSLNAAANQLVTIAKGQTFTSYIGMVGAAPGGAPVLTINGKPYSAIEYNVGSGATYLVDSQTLTPGGEVTIEGINGEKTISLIPAGTALVVEFNGSASTSRIEDAYGVKPTNAPILTIGNEKFTAMNMGATYIVDGQTLTPGSIKIVKINDDDYIISLSPYATILEVVEVGTNGKAPSTMFQTLFPSTVAATLTSTSLVNSVLVTGDASVSNASPTEARNSDDVNGAISSLSMALAGAAMTVGSLALALWL